MKGNIFGKVFFVGLLWLVISSPVFSQTLWNINEYVEDGRNMASFAKSFMLQFGSLYIDANGEIQKGEVGDKNTYAKINLFTKIMDKDWLQTMGGSNNHYKEIMLSGGCEKTELFGMLMFTFSAVKIDGKVQPDFKKATIAVIGEKIFIKFRDGNDKEIVLLTSESQYKVQPSR